MTAQPDTLPPPALDPRLEELRDLADTYEEVARLTGSSEPASTLHAELAATVVRLSHDFGRCSFESLPQAMRRSAVRLYLAAPDRDALLAGAQERLEGALRTADVLGPQALALSARGAIARPSPGQSDPDTAARVVALLLAGLDRLSAAGEAAAE